MEEIDRGRRGWARVAVRHAATSAVIVPLMAGVLLTSPGLWREGPIIKAIAIAAFVLIDWGAVFYSLSVIRAGELIRRPAECVGPSIALYAVLRVAVLMVVTLARPTAGLLAYTTGVTLFFALVTWRSFGRMHAERQRLGFPVGRPGVSAATPVVDADDAAVGADVGEPPMPR
jgi:hypothetical protein